MNYQEIRNIIEDVFASQSKETREYIDSRLTEHHKLINDRLDYFGREINSLVKIVRDGNGQAPLVSRMVSLEKDVESLKKLQDVIDADKVANTQGRWMVWAAMVTGFMGLLASAFALIHG